MLSVKLAQSIWLFITPCTIVKWRKVAQSCPTLCDPMDCSLPGFSVHGIFQARVLEWVATSFSKSPWSNHSRINYSHHAVCYIPWTYLSYNWKLVPFDHLAPFTCYLPLTTTKLFSVSMSSIFVHCFLDSTYKWDCMVFVFLCLTYFT